MKITAAFILGILMGLAFARAGKVRWFRDTPITPEGWQPRFRQWRNGEEIPWTLKN